MDKEDSLNMVTQILGRQTISIDFKIVVKLLIRKFCSCFVSKDRSNLRKSNVREQMVMQFE